MPPFDVTKFITDPELALLIISYIAAIYGAWKGWWVPGPLYTKLEARSDKADTANEKMLESIKALTDEVRRSGERK